MPRTQLPADIYGRSLAKLVENHNDNPTRLKERIAELEDTVAVQAETIRKLRAELAAIEDASANQAPADSRRLINGRPAVTLREAAKLARISYQAAYRRIKREVRSAPGWAHHQDESRIIWVYTDQSL
jgi:uncharacterized coiled-coil protein SlyX